MNRFLPAAILLAGLLGTVVVSAGPTRGFPAGPELPEATGAAPVGLAGCASSNCHGRSDRAVSPEETWKSSCTVWAANDPHARAYDVLDPEKNAIAKKMRAVFGRREKGYDPRTDGRCLACHANPAVPAGPEFDPIRREGVGCEACHGNAGVWVRTHTQVHPPDRNGLAELNDPGARAAVCAGCHVGAPGRDMNHDMIAAGHPKLNFEFASHLARLPKHWWERDRKTKAERGPAFLLDAWAAGAFAAGEAACRLSIDRQTRKDPWPELAEWNCYACHHPLEQSTWRPAAAFVKQKTAVWTVPWPLNDAAAADALRNGLGGRVAEQVGKVNLAAGDSRLEPLKVLGDGLKKDGAGLSGVGVAKVFQAIDATPDIPDWDTGYRKYLALGVLEKVRRDTAKTENAGIAAALKDVEAALGLPKHPVEEKFDPGRVRDAIKVLSSRLRAGWGK